MCQKDTIELGVLAEYIEGTTLHITLFVIPHLEGAPFFIIIKFPSYLKTT